MYPVISEVMSFKPEGIVVLDSSKGLKGCFLQLFIPEFEIRFVNMKTVVIKAL